MILFPASWDRCWLLLLDAEGNEPTFFFNAERIVRLKVLTELRMPKFFYTQDYYIFHLFGKPERRLKNRSAEMFYKQQFEGRQKSSLADQDTLMKCD